MGGIIIYLLYFDSMTMGVTCALSNIILLSIRIESESISKLALLGGWKEKGKKYIINYLDVTDNLNNTKIYVIVFFQLTLFTLVLFLLILVNFVCQLNIVCRGLLGKVSSYAPSFLPVPLSVIIASLT